MSKARQAFTGLADAAKRITPAFIKRLHRRPSVNHDWKNNYFHQQFRIRVDEDRRSRGSSSPPWI